MRGEINAWATIKARGWYVASGGELYSVPSAAQNKLHMEMCRQSSATICLPEQPVLIPQASNTSALSHTGLSIDCNVNPSAATVNTRVKCCGSLKSERETQGWREGRWTGPTNVRLSTRRLLFVSCVHKVTFAL